MQVFEGIGTKKSPIRMDERWKSQPKALQIGFGYKDAIAHPVGHIEGKRD